MKNKPQKMNVMKKIRLHIIAVTALLFAFSGSLFAQSTLKGVIRNETGGIPWDGVNVIITYNENSQSMTTEASGEYIFTDVTSNTEVTLSLHYPGYTFSYERTFLVNPGINEKNFWINALVDGSGNYYSAIEIGNQVWMGENLKTTNYNDGNVISNLSVDSDWEAEDGTEGHNGAYCWYDNDDTYKVAYGGLYNWYSVNTDLLCPTGWHVPTNTELVTLIDYVGGTDIGGGKLREIGITHWQDPNDEATNETVFTAVGGGDRGNTGAFCCIRGNGFWWSSSFESSEDWFLDSGSEPIYQWYNPYSCKS